MTLANQSFKDGWSDTVLVELIFLLCVLFDFLAIDDDFLHDLLLGVLSTFEADDELGELAGDAVRCLSSTQFEICFCLGQVVAAEFG